MVTISKHFHVVGTLIQIMTYELSSVTQSSKSRERQVIQDKIIVRFACLLGINECTFRNFWIVINKIFETRCMSVCGPRILKIEAR